MARRCRNCYSYGHNRRTCPQITKRLREKYEIAVEKNQEDITFWAEKLQERTGIDPRTGQKVKRKASANRKCSYCKHKHGVWSDAGLGHTRRTCADLKRDKKAAYEENAKLRRKVVKAMKKSGIGIGAVVNFKKYDYYKGVDGEKVYEQRAMPWLVTDILWDSVTADTYQPNVLRLTRLDLLGSNNRTSHHGITLPRLQDEAGNALTNWNGRQMGDWDIELAEGTNYQDTWLQARCPPNGLSRVPADYYDGASRQTDSHFDNKKR